MTRARCLAIETSSATGSVALDTGDRVLERTIATPREQTPLVLQIVADLLTEADLELAGLDALVFGQGPGSFTGLRIAAAVAQGLSLASGVPIVGVSSLAALAERGLAARRGQAGRRVDADRALCAVDARMGEVYWGVYRSDDGSVVAESAERIGSPESVIVPDAAFIGLGDAFSACAAALSGVRAAAVEVDAQAGPRARELLVLAAADVAAGRFLSIEAALPVYLRGSDAWRRC